MCSIESEDPMGSVLLMSPFDVGISDRYESCWTTDLAVIVCWSLTVYLLCLGRLEYRGVWGKEVNACNFRCLTVQQPLLRIPLDCLEYLFLLTEVDHR